MKQHGLVVTTSALKDPKAGGQGFDPCLQQLAIFLFIFRESSAHANLMALVQSLQLLKTVYGFSRHGC